MSVNRFPKISRVAAVAMLIAACGITAIPIASAQVNILTNKMDNARDGQNPNETLLTLQNVNSNTFGKLFAFNVDGYIQAQPLYMSNFTINGTTQNVLFVADMNNSVYAINADTGAQLWEVNLGPVVPSSVEGCGGVTGTGFSGIGILSTPVIDPTTNTMYLTAKTYVSNVAAYSLHALDITTGLEKFGGPVNIAATSGTLTFTPLNYIQRPGVLESNGTIWLAFGSNGCDINARGWLMAYSAANLSQLAVMVTQPDQSWGSSLWNGGVGPAADSNGNVYLSTANGYFNYSTNDLGDSVLKLSLGSGVINLEDYFTPYDQANMGANDIDLGSGQVVLLPYQTGSSTPDLLVTSGKDADIYLINTDDLGEYNTSGNTQIPYYIPSALGNQFFGAPVYWNNQIYFLAHQDYLRSYTLSVNSAGNSVIIPLTTTTSKLTTTVLPVISANGTTNGIVWMVRDVSNVAKLSAYDANLLLLLYDSGMASGGRDSLGTPGHFATPIVANGKVYMGTQTQLVAYGLFQQVNATGGNTQTAYVGTTLPTALTINSVNPYTNQPIPNVTVTFSDGGAGGTFSNPTVVTDVNGNATTTYTLPTKPKTITITGSSSGYSSAIFTETAAAGPVSALSTVSGGKQTGTVGTTLPNPLVVKAKDPFGNLVTGASVNFTDGVGGTFNPNPAATGSNGEASTSYTLPIVAKTLTVTASVGTVYVDITETSTIGPAAMVLVIQGNNQTAHKDNKLPKTLIVSVTDQYGNGISGLTVNFTDNGAGGTFSNANPVTNSKGQATATYTTPDQTGAVTIDATYSTLSPAVFTETVD